MRSWHSLLVVVRPGQSQPVSVHIVIIFNHVVGRLVGGHENNFELSRRVALLHQIRVEIAQDGREVSTRRTPSCGEVDPHHFVPQRLVGIDEIPVFIHECPPGEHLHHGCWLKHPENGCKSKSPGGSTALRVALAHYFPSFQHLAVGRKKVKKLFLLFMWCLPSATKLLTANPVV